MLCYYASGVVTSINIYFGDFVVVYLSGLTYQSKMYGRL